MFARIAERTDLFERMAAAIGVGDRFSSIPDGPAALREATLRCLGCSDQRACASWLSDRTVAAAPPAFCRNRDLFVGLRRKPPLAA